MQKETKQRIKQTNIPRKEERRKKKETKQQKRLKIKEMIEKMRKK